MLTVKFYTAHVKVLIQCKAVAIIEPKADAWDKALKNLPLHNCPEKGLPYTVLVGTSDRLTSESELVEHEEYYGIFGSDQCYVTNDGGKTVEVIRPTQRAQDYACS